MGILGKLEKGVGRGVNGVFSRFGSKDLQPVDLSGALEEEIDSKAKVISQSRTAGPSEYRFELRTPDFDKIEEWGAEALANELADGLTKYASSQSYTFEGPVTVIFEENLDISKGEFRLTSESVKGNAAPVTNKDEARGFPVLEISGRQYLLTAAKTIIGRGSDCDIVIDDPGISRKHLEITITPRGVVARDLHSTNGVYVEGHLVPAATLIDGNTITIGRTRILFYASSELRS